MVYLPLLLPTYKNKNKDKGDRRLRETETETKGDEGGKGRMKHMDGAVLGGKNGGVCEIFDGEEVKSLDEKGGGWMG